MLPPDPNAEAIGTGAAAQLGRYLDGFGQRLGRAIWLRAAALMALAALGLTLAGSWLAIRTGFGAGMLAWIRLALLLAFALAALGLLVLPLRTLRRQRARAVEALAGEFDGRLTTYAGLRADHPFRELLARDALDIAARHPPRVHVGRTRLAVPGLAAGALLLALVWLVAFGPGLYRDAARAIWGGWLLAGLLPAEHIQVDPGNQAVRRGGTVTVRSWATGFDPDAAQLHARVGGGPWQRIDMARAARDFEFTFFSVREPVSYYVSAAGIRSPTYELKVVDVPDVDRLRLVYHYPDWTRRPDTVQEGDGDISAIGGTRVQLRLRTDGPLSGGELVLDGAATPLAVRGNEAQADIQVARDARYYLAARIGAERVRLTDDYLIKLLPVPAPKVRVAWPGRDYSASSIEEVTTDVQASDDYGLTSVQLRYSVNGGAWRSVALPVTGRDTTDQHVFSLESLQPDAAARALAAGDLISYYAVARGHALSSQSDMYFIDVQPFDRRFSQSQSAGGAGGGDEEQQQISQRQREILISTWNLLRQKQQLADTGGATGGGAIRDNAALLATLQTKLAAQAQTLAGRTQARQLVDADPKIAHFIDSMKLAARAMQPAAAHLAATDLGAAIAPEQQALQYLLQAQSQFTDVRVALQRGGGATQSGRDVAQIYQLEMDLQKNQYESGEDASPRANDRQADELARRLQDLARRQQQLADQMQRSPQPTAAQRWQQQSLQREAQELQQQLAQNRQGAAASGAPGTPSSAGAAGSAGGAAGPGTAPSSGASSAASGAAGPTGGALPDGSDPNGLLAQRLRAAVDAMSQASTAMRTDGAAAAERARQAAQQAQQALNGAGTELARERAQAMQQAIAQMADRAGQLYGQQAEAERQVQAAVRAGPQHGRLPLDGTRREQLTEQKRELSAGVQRLGDQIAAAAARYRGEAPQTSAALSSAGQVLSDSDLRDRLDIAAQYIDAGDAAYIAPSESAVTQALRELQGRLQAAEGVAGHDALAATAARDPVSDELARVRALRSELQRLADAAQSPTAGATGGHATGGNAAGGNAAGSSTGGGPLGSGVQGAALGAQRQVAAGAAGLVPLLRAQGADPRDLATIERLTHELGEADIVTGRVALLTQRLRARISLLDELELQLARRGQSQQSIRAAVDSRGAEQYQAAVAEYYRQLSRQ